MAEGDARFAALYEVGRYINSSLDLAEVLELAIDTILRVTGAERGFIVLADPDSSELRVQIARNFGRSPTDTPSFEVSRNIVHSVVERGTPLLVNDALSDPSFQRFQSVLVLGLHSVLCAPLRVKGRTIGAIYVDNRRRLGLFTQSHLDLLVAFADQAAIAIENARLYQGLQQRLREIADLQAYQENVFRSVASGIVALDHAGCITSFNTAAEVIFGAPAEQVLGRGYDAVLGPDMAQFVRAYLAGAPFSEQPADSGQDIACEIPGRGRIYLSVRATPLRAADERAGGLVLAIEDQTENRLLRKARQAEEEKRRLLSRFFAPAVLEEILRNPEAAANLAGVRKELTVLFADLRGYTTLSEHLPPEQIVTLLNCCLDLATRAIRTCNGTVDKYIGDAVLALFNAPTEQANHPELAIWAALALQGTSARLRHVVGRHVRFGIGLNTGEAVAGYIGTPEQLSYTAIGDAVNVAARLQASAAPGEVLISEATYRRVQHVFEAQCLGPLEVKGRSEPVTAYRVLGPRVAAAAPEDRLAPTARHCPACGATLPARQLPCPACHGGAAPADADYLELPGGQRYALVRNTVTLGRGAENDLMLADTAISRRHARLQRLSQGWLLIDWKSSNGTRVNGILIDGPYLLEDGDVIVLGDRRLVFRSAPQSEPSAVDAKHEAAATVLGRLAFLATPAAPLRGAGGE